MVVDLDVYLLLQLFILFGKREIGGFFYRFGKIGELLCIKWKRKLGVVFGIGELRGIIATGYFVKSGD